MVVGLWPEPPEVGFAAEFAAGGGVHTEYQTRPLDWIAEKLGIPPETIRWSLVPGYDLHRWDGTEDPLYATLDALAGWHSVGVESATGTGKSFLAACIVLWFLACHEDARVYTYAPKEDQLRLFMWAEISRLWPRFQRHFPTAKLSDLRIRMDGVSDRWSAHGYAVRIRAGEESATGAQGAHAEHMLLITEETPGIDASVMSALENTRTSPHNLQLSLGNPDSQHDELHRFCTSLGVVHIRISALDHPNVVTGELLVPGAVSVPAVVRRRERYGEDSRLYQSRVRGISPAEAEDALIRWAWCEEAAERWSLPQFRDGPVALGVDVAASEAGDKAAIARYQGACLVELRSMACPDPVAYGLDIGALIKADGIDPRLVGVDSVGVGAGTVNRLKELGYVVAALNGGAKPVGSALKEATARTGRGVYAVEAFANLRAQMWWRMRQDLQAGVIALPSDRELWEDLTVPVWWTHNGKIHVESKEDIVARLGRSPDKGDAAVYGNWVRTRPKYIPDPEPKKNRNVDTGLEKVLQRLNSKRRERW